MIQEGVSAGLSSGATSLTPKLQEEVDALINRDGTWKSGRAIVIPGTNAAGRPSGTTNSTLKILIERRR